jgi:hypothetical protein
MRDMSHIPVWYLEKDGCTFVRSFKPRTSGGTTHIIRGYVGDKLKEKWPSIINVGTHPETQEMG